MKVKNVEIRSYVEENLEGVIKLFCNYFRNDFGMQISDEGAKKMCTQIGGYSMEGIIPLDLMFIDDEMIGFISYQIDSEKSDWCEREGWGFIREIHIDSSMRGLGLGRKLVNHAEQKLYHMGVTNIYLTSDDTGSFWEKCGYKCSGLNSKLNEDPIYEKIN